MFTQKDSELILSEIRFTYSRSSGPGGQNVNKRSTKAHLRWDLQNSQLPLHKKERIQDYVQNNQDSLLNKENQVIMTCDQTRSREQNKITVTRNLLMLVQKALTPQKKRVPTKPTNASVEKRLEKKHRISQKKESRKKVEI